MTPTRQVYLDNESELRGRIKKLEDDLARLTNRFWLQRGQGGASSERLVWGSVYNDGDINKAGSGDWTVEETDYGFYTITIDPPFPNDNLSIQATSNSNNPVHFEGRYGASSYDSPTASTVYIRTDDFDDADIGSGQDGGFDFLIIGEQG